MSMFGAVASLPQTVMNLINPHTKSSNVIGTARGGVKANAATPTSPTATSTAAQATTDIRTTFLSLLTKELQNQDPTAPMDSTAMVGQMISLNQLDQLIAINQTLTTPAKAATTAAPKSYAVQPSADSAAALAAQQALLASTNPTAGSAVSPLSTDLTLNAAAQSAANAGVLNLTNFNSMFGGK